MNPLCEGGCGVAVRRAGVWCPACVEKALKREAIDVARANSAYDVKLREALGIMSGRLCLFSRFESSEFFHATSDEQLRELAEEFLYQRLK